VEAQRGDSGPSGPRASWGRRLVAYFIDSVLLLIAFLIVLAITNQAVASVLNLVIGLAYFAYFEGSASGQTLGKRALGIRVIDFRTGGAIGYGRGLIRYIGKIISSIPCLLGFLWALWDKEKQTWHDKIATTVVVPEADYPVAGR
jgi:uncharacterized RDD family membrane protein YckC